MANYTKPWEPVRQSDVLELVGADETVAQNQLSEAVSFAPASIGSGSGNLTSFVFISSGGDVLTPAGQLLIFSADPGHSTGDDGSGISAAEWENLIGVVDVAAADWSSEDNAAYLAIDDQIIPFHAVSNLYLVWRLTSATSINSDAADDELLKVNIHYTRDS